MNTMPELTLETARDWAKGPLRCFVMAVIVWPIMDFAIRRVNFPRRNRAKFSLQNP
jgi:hypothetical protein